MFYGVSDSRDVQSVNSSVMFQTMQMFLQPLKLADESEVGVNPWSFLPDNL